MLKNALSIILFFSVTILRANFGYTEETAYLPYPIIFVHGVNASMTKTWGYTKNQLEKYFKDGNGYKYFHNDKQNYFPDCDYSFTNNGDIRSIAWVLKASIDNALRELPEDQKKVIIVAHSMGGLVVRSLLKQLPDYQSKIDRVVFIGTPNLGAPAASVLWIYNEIAQKDLPALLEDNINFYSQTSLTSFRFQQTATSTSYFDNRRMAVLAEEEKIAKILAGPKVIGPYPDGIALEELRLSGFVSCSYYIDSYGIEPIPIIKSINGSDTFLGKASSFLANPSNFKVVRGINTQSNISSWAIDKVIGKYEKDFTFPSGQSLSDAATTGDGIVPRASQEGIGAANYTISAFHTDEPSAYQTILQALDDPPVIEDVRIVQKYKDKGPMGGHPYGPHGNNYLIIRVKDYLLADIEISEMNICNKSLSDFPEFYDSQANAYKPYTKFGKDFLKERFDTTAPIIMNYEGTSKEYLHLYPGEFYVEIRSGSFPVSGYIKVKNAAREEADCQIIKMEGTADWPIATVDVGKSGNSSSTASYEQARNQAYDAFSSDIWDLGAIPYQYHYFGFRSWANSWHDYTDDNIDIWGASISVSLLSYINFIVNTGPKKIKSAKLTGTFLKTLKGGGTNFNILVYRDTTNIWPPTLNSTGDSFLFSIDTSPYQEGDDFEIDINPSFINTSGANVLMAKPDFPIYNWIPTSVDVSYERHAGIWYPALILIFDKE